MGCCSEPTFEEAVRKDIMRYINSLSMSGKQRNEIIAEINDDLSKKNAAFDSYHYEYREDDVTKVVNEYKNKIEMRLNSNGGLEINGMGDFENLKNDFCLHL